jgi:tetratricopeptide (TPR) repeat protein
MTASKEQIAINYLKSGDYKLSLEHFNSLIIENPHSPDLLGYRGAVLLNLKKKKEALLDFNRAVELDPDYSFRYASRAFAKDALGDIEGAIADYQIAINLDPDDAIAHNNLGLLQEKIGNKVNAKKYFDSADALAASQASNEPTIPTDVEFSENIFDNEKINSTTPNKTENYLKVVKKVFSSKHEFANFVSFVKKGFKQ